MRRILAGVILLILYGSLYPWHFVSSPEKGILVWPHTLDRGDVLVNVLLYIPLGACAYLAFPKLRRMRFVVPVTLALSLSLSVEMTQAFEPVRSSQLSDVIANIAGGAIGMVLAAFVPLPLTAESFLLVSWVAHLLFFGSSWWPIELAGWLVVASAVMPSRSMRWRWPVAVACYAAILLHGLAPFRFVPTASHFNWLPFEAFILSQWESMIPILMAKLFWYSAAVWVLWRVGCSWMAAGVSAACFLGAIELAQRHIPPHVSEITDPLIALLLAAAFASLLSKTRAAEVRT